MNPLHYAAEVLRDLSVLIDRHPEADMRAALVTLRKVVANSQHFVLPANGVLIGDGFRGLAGEPVRLPYPQITIAYHQDKGLPGEGEIAVPDRLVVALEMDRGMFESHIDNPHFPDAFRRSAADIAAAFIGPKAIEIVWFGRSPGATWVPSPMGWLMPSEWDSFAAGGRAVGDDALIPGRPIAILPIPNHLRTREATEALARDTVSEAVPVLELCEALQCTNVRESVLSRAGSVAVNAKRERNGKLPMLELRSLVVDVSPSAVAGFTRTGGIHASPRQHLRRGHVRRLASGRKTWVQPCVVGGAQHGVILKGYVVRDRGPAPRA